MTDNPSGVNAPELVPVQAPASDPDPSPAQVAVVVTRDGHGHLLPGSSLNPRGRARGSKNSATLAAAKMLERGVKKAVRNLLRALDDDNPYVRSGASMEVVRRVLPPEVLGRLLSPKGQDGGWVEYATDAELDAVAGIIAAASARKLASAPSPGPRFPWKQLPAAVTDEVPQPVDLVITPEEDP